MKIILKLIKFGKILNSRPSGREAVLRAKQIINGSKNVEEIVVDFGKVSIVTPSYLDEFISGIKKYYSKNKITMTGYRDNIVIEDTLKALDIV